mgnify:CR=1 FL=1
MANWKLAKSEGRGVRLEARSEEGARRTAEWRLDPRKAVAARKAAAPPEVRTVLDDSGFARLHRSGSTRECAWLCIARARPSDLHLLRQLSEHVVKGFRASSRTEH